MKEKPVRITPNPWSWRHKTETRIFAREIHEQFCAQKGCRFYGKHASQGTCHTRKGDYFDWGHLEKIEKKAVAELNEYRRMYRRKYGMRRYVQMLESMHVCDNMNSAFTLDELVRLRRDNAILKDKLHRRRNRER